MNPVIIAVAIAGSVPRKKDNPAVSVTVSEQVESTQEAYGAGATLVHLPVRNPDESASSDLALFASVLEGIRKHCPGMIVQFATGGRGRDQSGRGAALHQKPDMACLPRIIKCQKSMRNHMCSTGCSITQMVIVTGLSMRAAIRPLLPETQRCSKFARRRLHAARVVSQWQHFPLRQHAFACAYRAQSEAPGA